MVRDTSESHRTAAHITGGEQQTEVKRLDVLLKWFVCLELGLFSCQLP